MDNKQVMARIEELLKEKHLTLNALKENTSISTTVYQWKKNAERDATRTPSLRSIEKICAFFKISLSYFFAESKEEQLSVRQEELFGKIKQLKERELDAIENIVDLLREKGNIL